MDAKSLRKLGPELKSFLARFADCFEYQAESYLATYVRGQLSDLARKSVEPMALQAAVPPRSLQEFLTHLQWDDKGVRDRVQKIVATQHMAGVTIALVDETSFVKKGTKLNTDGNPVHEVGMLNPFQSQSQRFLSGQQNLQRRTVGEGGTDQQAKIGQRVGVQQMGFIEDQQDRPLDASNSREDLSTDLVFVLLGLFAELRLQQFHQTE